MENQNKELLKVELEALQEMAYDLSLTGFDEKELAGFFNTDEDTKDDDFDVDGELEKPCITKALNASLYSFFLNPFKFL